MVERDCPRRQRPPKAGAARRRLISVAATLLVLPVLPRLAQAATILAVRTWPADEYTRASRWSWTASSRRNNSRWKIPTAWWTSRA